MIRRLPVNRNAGALRVGMLVVSDFTGPTLTYRIASITPDPDYGSGFRATVEAHARARDMRYPALYDRGVDAGWFTPLAESP